MSFVVVSPTTIRRSLLGLATLFPVLIGASALWLRAQSAGAVAPTPGAAGDGTTLLSNGWRLGPAGRHIPLSTLPLNIVQSPDGRYLVVTNNGLTRPSLTMVDVNAWSIKNTTPVDNAWLGLAWHPDGTRLYSA